MSEFYQIESVHRAKKLLLDKVNFNNLRIESVSLEDGLGRVLAGDIVSDIDIPGFDRSTVDGYAVMAKDTFGATESMPAYLSIAGEVLMGQEAKLSLLLGQTVKVATGGMLPEGADAVVMLEYTEEMGADSVCVLRPVAPGENVVHQGEDLSLGSTVLKKGHLLRPQDLGILAGVGVTKVTVYKRPQVAIISTGDELISPEKTPLLGQVRDINSYALMGLVEAAGGEAVLYGVIPDTYKILEKITAKALENCDIVIISGGSSVGTRDVTAKVLNNLGKPGVLVHGVSVKPGRPTILGAVRGKAVYGLPGHPVSAMIIFDIFTRPVIEKLLGFEPKLAKKMITASLTRNIASTAGREDYIRVMVKETDGRYLAEPVLGKSGLISTMVNADGIVKISMDAEGLSAGDMVEVILF